MNSRFGRLVLSASIALLSWTQFADAAPFSDSLFFNVDRYPQDSGIATYDIQIDRMFGAFPLTLTAPSGRIWYFSPTGTYSEKYHLTLSDLTESDVLEELVGPWTISSSGSPPYNQAYQMHSFSIDDFSDSIFSIPPEILSPPDGSIVPPEFTVSFEWPEGVEPPSSRAVTVSYTGFHVVGTRPNVGQNTFSVGYGFNPGVTHGEMTLRVGTFNHVSQFVSPVTTSEEDPAWDFDVSLTYYNWSAPLSLTGGIVPEPSAALLLCFGLAGLSFVRRRS